MNVFTMPLFVSFLFCFLNLSCMEALMFAHISRSLFFFLLFFSLLFFLPLPVVHQAFFIGSVFYVCV